MGAREDAQAWARRAVRTMLKRLMTFMAIEHERSAAELREALERRNAPK